jgi:GNAT superfamily N-acetyltransferase
VLPILSVLPFDESRDSFAELTNLVNSAYSSLARLGFNYVAATQEEEVTKGRINAATQCWVARKNGRLVGTVSYYDRARHQNEPEWYRRPGACYFGLFAVDPELQGQGIGLALLDAVEERARKDGKTELSCDTAEGAKHLIRFYAKRDYRIVGKHRWPHARYTSVVLSKTLGRLDASLAAVDDVGVIRRE